MPREEALQAYELFKDHATNRLEIAHFFSLVSGEEKVRFAEEVVYGVSKLRLVDAQDADARREGGEEGDGGEEVRGPGFQMGDGVLIHSKRPRVITEKQGSWCCTIFRLAAGKWRLTLGCAFWGCAACMHALCRWCVALNVSLSL